MSHLFKCVVSVARIAKLALVSVLSIHNDVSSLGPTKKKRRAVKSGAAAVEGASEIKNEKRIPGYSCPY